MSTRRTNSNKKASNKFTLTFSGPVKSDCWNVVRMHSTCPVYFRIVVQHFGRGQERGSGKGRGAGADGEGEGRKGWDGSVGF